MSEPKEAPKKTMRMEIKIDDEIARGIYANLCLINHSDAEFIFDFVFIQPARKKSKVASRLVMAPKNAKRLMMLLQQQVKIYEDRFGKLDITPPVKMDIGELEIN
ncbi:MAG TPA: DUF3467 domain-containing protein [bacterium]|nr:DUF3467 domain-containing protein [bacterium]